MRDYEICSDELNSTRIYFYDKECKSPAYRDNYNSTLMLYYHGEKYEIDVTQEVCEDIQIGTPYWVYHLDKYKTRFLLKKPSLSKLLGFIFLLILSTIFTVLTIKNLPSKKAI